MATMKAVRIHGYGGSEVLTYEDAPQPEPSAGELLIQVRAASVNPFDWKLREGYLRQFMDPPLPKIMGCDMAGDVVALGSDVTAFQVGDAVFGMVNMGAGTHAEYVAVPTIEVATKPSSLDYETAAAVPLSALAAWQALVETAQLVEGQTALILSAAGGVGSFAVQFAHMLGARVIGVASQANAEFVRSLGADEVIDYQTTRFEEVLSEVDVVLDLLGGDSQERCWDILKPGGILVTLVGLSPLSVEKCAADGIRSEMVITRPDGAQLQKIADLIDAGQIKPVVNKVFPLSEARQAYDLSQSGHVRGKLVLRVTNP